MSSDKKTRGNTCDKLFEESFYPIDEYKATCRLPTGRIMIGRMLFLTRQEAGYKSLSKKKASEIVVKEFRTDWINKKCIPNAQIKTCKKDS